MNRQLITCAAAFVAVLTLTLSSSNAEARHCRSRGNRCCGQTSNCGYQQGGNCGYQQTNNCGSGIGGLFRQRRNCGSSNCGFGCNQTARYGSASTACCNSQSAWQSGQPTSGTAPQSYDAPTPGGNSPPPTPVAAPPAPEPAA